MDTRLGLGEMKPVACQFFRVIPAKADPLLRSITEVTGSAFAGMTQRAIYSIKKRELQSIIQYSTLESLMQ